MGERGPAFKIAAYAAPQRLPARRGRPILSGMKRTFKALKPSAAKAKSQPAAAERKPAGKQPDAQDLDRAAQRKATAQPPKTGGDTAGNDKAGTPKEVGGPDGPEPTRYGDWERGGICYDF
jgi:hypothetical protein